MKIICKFSHDKQIILDNLEEENSLALLINDLQKKDRSIKLKGFTIIFKGEILDNLELTLSELGIIDNSILAIIKHNKNRRLNTQLLSIMTGLNSFVPASSLYNDTSLDMLTSSINDILSLNNQENPTFQNNLINLPLTFTNLASTTYGGNILGLLQNNDFNTVLNNASSQELLSLANELENSINNLTNTNPGVITNQVNNQNTSNISIGMDTSENSNNNNRGDGDNNDNVENVNGEVTTSITQLPPITNNSNVNIGNIVNLINQSLNNISVESQDIINNHQYSGSLEVDPNLETMTNMGYEDRELNRLALESCNNNLEEALQWIENLR